MKKLRKFITLLGFVLLMVLASVGMSITGAAPIMPTNKREDAIVINVEEVESNDADIDFSLLEIKKS